MVSSRIFLVFLLFVSSIFSAVCVYNDTNDVIQININKMLLMDYLQFDFSASVPTIP